jgi:hypothetical protein
VTIMTIKTTTIWLATAALALSTLAGCGFWHAHHPRLNTLATLVE